MISFYRTNRYWSLNGDCKLRIRIPILRHFSECDPNKIKIIFKRYFFERKYYGTFFIGKDNVSKLNDLHF